MKSVSALISLAGYHFAETRHVCAFFNSDEEEYRILLPFIKDGLKSGDKAVHVLNPEQRQGGLLIPRDWATPLSNRLAFALLA
jgi:hypothetical protein